MLDVGLESQLLPLPAGKLLRGGVEAAAEAVAKAAWSCDLMAGEVVPAGAEAGLPVEDSPVSGLPALSLVAALCRFLLLLLLLKKLSFRRLMSLNFIMIQWILGRECLNRVTILHPLQKLTYSIDCFFFMNSLESKCG